LREGIKFSGQVGDYLINETVFEYLETKLESKDKEIEDGIDLYQSSLKEEIEKQLTDMNHNAIATSHRFYRHTNIFSVDDVIKLLTTVTPKN
jgi:hypothetical protein